MNGANEATDGLDLGERDQVSTRSSHPSHRQWSLSPPRVCVFVVREFINSLVIIVHTLPCQRYAILGYETVSDRTTK